jgi:hypothetical protein
MIEVYPHIFLWNQKIANNGKLAGYTEKRNPSVGILKFTSLVGRIGRGKKELPPEFYAASKHSRKGGRSHGF